MKNILMIIVDCLRSDMVFGKNRPVVTPNIDRLKKESTGFTQLIGPTASTAPCMPSILIGEYPFVHGLESRGHRKLAPGIKNIAEALKEKGYNTYAELCTDPEPLNRLSKGFDEFNIRDFKHLLHSDWGESFIKRFREKGFKEPWFLVLHFYVLHRPRFMTREFNNRRFGRVAYERAVSCFDHHLGKILENVDENTAVLLFGDHGEVIPKNKLQEYFNHLSVLYYHALRTLGLTYRYSERESHGFNLSEDVLRVPLLIKNLPGFGRNKIVHDLVRSIDIAPTIADVFGLNEFESRHGKSMLRNLGGRDGYIYVKGGKLLDKKRWIEGIRTNEYKFICHTLNKDKWELYSSKDGFQANIVNEKPGQAKKLFNRLEELKENVSTAEDEEEALKNLRELGYAD